MSDQENNTASSDLPTNSPSKPSIFRKSSILVRQTISSLKEKFIFFFKSLLSWYKQSFVIIREHILRLPLWAKILGGILLSVGVVAAHFSPTITSIINQRMQPPQVISVFPPDGAIDVETTTQIELTFNIAMNHSSVENALIIEPLVEENTQHLEGDFEWINSRNLRFKPNEKLAKGTKYLIQITQTAKGKNGKLLNKVFSSTFTTLGNPKIIFSSPVDNSELDTLITVMFDRPMVSLTTAQANVRREDILEIEPEIIGQGKWIGTSSFVFRPDQPLTPSTKYAVTVKKNLTTPQGDVFSEDYSFSFITQRPTVSKLAYHNPGYSSTTEEEKYFSNVYDFNRVIEDIGPLTSWKVIFSLDMDRSSVEEYFQLIQLKPLNQGWVGEPIPVRFAWNSDKEVIIEPLQSLNPLILHQAFFDPGMRGKSGNYGTETELSWKFKTADLPGLISTTPSDQATNWGTTNEERGQIILEFKSPMDDELLEKNISISPEPETKIRVYGGKKIYLNFWQAASTTYTITIPQSAKDIFNRKLPQDYTISFSTAPLPKTIGFISSNSINKYMVVQNAQIAPTIATKVTNVSSINFELYELTDNQLVNLIAEKTNTSEIGTIWQKLDLSQFKKTHSWTRSFEMEPDVPFNVVTEITHGGQLFPPGLYFLEAKIEGGVHDNIILALSNTGLLLKTSPNQVFSWATNLSTGEPTTDMKIKVVTLDNRQLAEGTTNQDGIMQTNLTWPKGSYGYDNRQFIAIGRKNEAVGLVTWQFDEGIRQYDFGYYSSYYSEHDNTVVFLTLDRPIYRPGQKLHFKGYLRAEDDVAYSLPEFGSEIEIAINPGYYSVNDKETSRKTLKIDDFGSFSDSVDLADDLSTGGYVLSATYQGKTFTRSFKVETYRKPDYEVKIASNKPNYTAGDPAILSLTASYFGGGSVSKAPVNYTVSKSGEYFYWAEDGRFQFNQHSYFYHDYGYSSFIDDSEGERETDSQGRFVTTLNLTRDAEKDADWNVVDYEIYASVMDLNNQTVGKETNFPVYVSERPVGIKGSSYYGHKDKVSGFEIVTLDINQQRIAGERVTWEIYERVWTNIKELGDDGKYYTKSEPVDTLISQGQVVTNEIAKGNFSFTPLRAGYYIIKVKTKDLQKRTWESTLSYWVAAEDQLISFKKEDHDRIELVSEKEEYKVGESASIFAPLPFKNAKGLITVERQNILDYQVVDLSTNSQDFTVNIKDNYIPNVFVSLIAVKGGNTILNHPNFKIGVTKLLVEVTPRKLDLTIKTDKDQYQPRESVRYQITARDAEGNPIVGDFSLAVVDKAVLSLSDSNLADILEKFYFERDLEIDNNHSLIASLEKLIVNMGLGSKGGSGAAGNGGPEADTSRRKFLDTVTFVSNLRTDENGQASGTFELPDDLTTFNLLLIGSDKNTQVGATSKDILVARDLYIRPILPRFEIWGDQLMVGAVVQNQTDQTQSITVNVDTDGLLLTNGVSKNLTIEPAGSSKLYWPAQVLQEKEATITFLAQTQTGLEDSVKIYLPLKRPNTMEITSTGAHTQTSTTEFLDLPPGEVELDLSELTIQASASLLNQIEGGMDYTIGFPYECTEQIMTRALAALLNHQLNQKFDTNVLTDTYDHTAIINTNLQKLNQQQKVDGGWGYWSESDQSNPYLSAYVLFGLHRIKQAGISVNQQVYQQAKSYLANQIRLNDVNSENFKIQSYLVYVNSLVNEGSISYTQRLYENYLRQPTRFDISARVYFYLAMESLSQHSLNNRQILTTQKTRVFNDLIGLVRRTATTARWEEPHSSTTLSSTTKATALMVQALITNSPKSPLLNPTLNYLLEIKKDGYWQTTHNTIHVLLGLVDYINSVETIKPNYTYSIKLNDKPVLKGDFDKERVLEQDSITIKELSELGQGQLPISIKKQGPGTLYYNLNLKTFTPLDQIEPLDQGLAIDRVFFDQNGNEIQEVKAGETVTTRVTLIVPENRHHIVLEDYLPAGFEAINVSFATEHMANQETFTRSEEDGGWPVWFSHREVRDDRVLVFITYLPQGVYEFTYKARATTPGNFATLPARAYELYQPDVFGSGTALTFTVNP